MKRSLFMPTAFVRSGPTVRREGLSPSTEASGRIVGPGLAAEPRAARARAFAPGLLLSLMAASAGCETEPTSIDLPTATPAGTPVQRSAQDALPSGHPAVADLRVTSRGPRRLSVAELERSWEAVAGLAPGSVVIPENLARSLGRPDWLTTTEESLEPSPLFMKFMVDLGAILCTNVLQGDAGRPADSRIILREEDVDANLRQLILRFWALDASAPDHPDVARLRSVFEAGREGAGGDLSGWLAVCIALTTAPEFLLY